MATMDDILGNGGGTPPLKGSKEWHEQQQDAPSVSSPVKGTQKWTEQQAAAAPAVTGGRCTSGQTSRCERWQSLIR